MFYIALCEDLPEEAELLAELLARYQAKNPNIQMKTELFFDAAELVARVKGGHHFDLYLIDIILPDVDGISLAKRLRAEHTDAAIVFVTESKEYALEAFSVKAVNYLLKPITEDTFFPAMDDVLASMGQQSDTYTQISMPQERRTVKTSDILCVEVMGHRLCYYMVTGEELKSKVLRISFEQATADLAQDGRFFRPHRSFLVNADHVARLSKSEVVMKSGMRIPVSRLRFPEIKEAYMRYWGR